MTFFERAALSRKLALGFGAILLVALLVGVFGLQAQRQISTEFAAVAIRDFQGISDIKEARIHYGRMGLSLRQFLISSNQTDREKALKKITDSEAGLHSAIEAARKNINTPEAKQYLQQFDDYFVQYHRNLARAIEASKVGQNEPLAFVASPDYQKVAWGADDALANIVKVKEVSALTAEQYIKALAEANERLVIQLLIGGLLIGVLFSWLLSRSISRPIGRVRDAVEQLAAGRLNLLVPHTDYPNDVGELARAIAVLQAEAKQLAAQRWNKTHLASLSSELQTANSFSELGQKLLSTIAPLLKLGHGAFYVYEAEQQHLRLFGGYANFERKHLDQCFNMGQGLVGQCALERTPIIITQPPADYIRIGSSFCETVPRCIAVLPVLRNDRLLAVVELATFDLIDAEQQSLLDDVMPMLAMSLEILARNGKTQQLLKETQQQAEQMQQQAMRLELQTSALEAQQEEFRATDAWFRGIIESAPDGMLVVDERCVIVLANAQVEAMFDYSKAQLAALSIDALLPAAQELHVALLDSHSSEVNANSLAIKSLELQGICNGGREFPVEVGLSPLPALGGRGGCVCFTVRNISDRKAAEDRMVALEERSRLILGAVGDGIVGMDMDGYMTFVNSAVLDMLGFTEEELISNRMHALVHHHYPDGREYPRSECAMYLTTVDGQPRTVDNEVLWRKDGSPVPVEYSTTPVYKNEVLVGSVVVFRDITERKAAENARAVSEERLELALNSANLALWDWQSDINELITNNIWSEMLGYQREELDALYGNTAERWINMVHPDDVDDAVQKFTQFVNNEIPVHRLEIRMKTKSGEPRWILAVGDAVSRDENGKVLRMAGIHQDITERKQFEESIRTSQAQTRTLVDSINSVVFMKDLQGRHLLVNDEYQRATGISKTEIIGKTDLDVMPLEVANAITTQDRLVMVSRERQTYEERVPHLELGPRDYITTKLPLINEQGEVYGMCGIATDITERKQAEKALQHANFLNEQALELTRAGHWHIPLNQGSEYYISSERNATILGDPPRPDCLYHLGKECFANAEKANKEAAELMYQNYAAALAGTVPRYDATYAYQRPSDGRVIWVRAMGQVVRDEHGTATDMYGVTVDITESKLAEDAIRDAKQIAEEATQTKSNFLANMSHEIRTPMNAIIGMSHLALQTQLDKKQRNYIEKVHRSGENLLGIINDILDFSKIEAGKMSMEQTDFRLEDVMDNLGHLVGMKAEDKGLELLFNTAPDVPTTLVGDSLRLGQVLINLGNNAVKFTEYGEVIVSIEKVFEDDDGVELHFSVKDSGIGMTPEQCGKMFQSFSQADASTTRKYGGTGLGLAISKTLVELMHGRIWVESEVGKGSVFHFHARFGLQASPVQRRMFRADELRGIKVLVVDDNPSAREILSSMSRSFGMVADVADGGHEALKMLDEAQRSTQNYDLVLMDWKMPVMNGVETVMQLQSRPYTKSPAVIMVTAYGGDEAVSGATGLALNSVLSKPVTASTLLVAISQALGKDVVTETRTDQKDHTYQEAMAKLAGARVLLVEDNDMNQELAKELLGQAGMIVVVANHGQEALDILALDQQFDGVLMDCQMPVMDGYAATRAIRQNPLTRHLPIVAMTANAMAGDRDKVIEAGMLDHIAKPLNVGNMFTTIAKWFSSAKPPVASVVTSLAAKDESGLPNLPGVEVSAGLATTQNNINLYRKILAKFREGQRDFASLFAAARQGTDARAAERAAHTLKGTAGTIGAKALQAAAGQLESACELGAADAVLDELLAKVLAELVPVIVGLDALDKPASADATVPWAAPAAPLALEALRPLLKRLKALLEDNDAEAADLAEEIGDLVKGSELEKAARKVCAAVNEFDFDAALDELLILLGQIN
ncbi:PAS domain S-box protein [Deefgea piscis]|uniref:PAS domain S-box protein n=1 Tax=Deefgea piscis TaxID=2739061 RepID=UPI001C7F0042|nr:PAS domain S-box protein [Deefgea piscis]QZA79831.1 PAS domain S-box protein [Deefgea piscis]